jgi:hypothetical protein
MEPWFVTARNLPEHANNAIHTDVGAKAAGYSGALVAGTTVYGYLSHPVVVADPHWLSAGCGEVRFRSPVFDRDLVGCVPHDGVVSARVGDEVRATLTPMSSAHFSEASGEELETIVVSLDEDLADYGTRAGDDLELYKTGVVHPAVWPTLANRVFHSQLVTGSWVHTRSLIQHHSVASVGDIVCVRTTVQKRFTKATGTRAIALVKITSATDDRRIATLEHEAIIALPGASGVEASILQASILQASMNERKGHLS